MICPPESVIRIPALGSMVATSARAENVLSISTVAPEPVLHPFPSVPLMSDQTGLSRRAMMHLLGISILTSLVGCLGDSQNNDSTGSVPKRYRTATSQGGMKRDLNSLTSKSGANYQSNAPRQQHCATCRYYIPDKNGDSHGACTLVTGTIKPEAWCTLYAPSQNGQG
jgi:hypothetical protein